MLNVKLLRKVKKHILAEPRRLAMYDWIKRKRGRETTFLADDSETDVKWAKCGTAACIAGWTVILGKGSEHAQISVEAARLLGVDHWKLERKLFYPSAWGDKLDTLYEEAKTQTARAKIVAQAIEKFINEQRNEAKG